MNPTLIPVLQSFLARWLGRTVPNLQAVRVCRKTGAVLAKDHLGWRAVGDLKDYVSIARALGALPR